MDKCEHDFRYFKFRYWVDGLEVSTDDVIIRGIKPTETKFMYVCSKCRFEQDETNNYDPYLLHI